MRSTNTRADFEHALERLRAGTPENLDLQSFASRGTLRISLTTVAVEAGHSRTLISGKGCQFPDIRDAVLDASGRANQNLSEEGGHASSATTYDLIMGLREEVRLLRDEKAILATKAVEADAVVRKLEEIIAKQKSQIARLGGRRGPDRTEKVPQETNVVGFPHTR
ncbi:hypothetical protein [Oricola nitratireducens]|uniref:hypothetical protein n=1 Tax=Oricola nitratireducens TaxID=2775868 RepID=UPI001868B824|nr:hypothetical protein [Oricola nitratireducens]